MRPPECDKVPSYHGVEGSTTPGLCAGYAKERVVDVRNKRTCAHTLLQQESVVRSGRQQGEG